ncbi:MULTISPECIES: hypothetical protein [Polyangium]|uniref:HEPN domain-containing protein n=2 Tax=Polyangium TaxID=55 RepID=A0A4U1JIJ0_9BACT|nr:MULTISPECIES: hypothetical protein [Polyangium]MDI1435941.1 hypothetical protein [Polyangium sorediatum]TKD12471.1 hypothetical protein E8A74_05080 [Polyangium fumosum]
MATPAQVRAWIRQAGADLAAAKADTDALAECHRRYLIQQSYEKAIKALALMLWDGADDEMREFDRLFLGQHSPLKSLGESESTLSKALFNFRRRIETFLNKRVDNADLLLRIDATKPSKRPNDVSYRYPFLQDHTYIAPADFSAWDTYQGNQMGALAAVTHLLKEVNEELKRFARTPK